MAASQPLFSPDLISPAVSSSLPSPYKVRPLERGDYGKGFLDCLRVLTHIGDISEKQFIERYEFMATQGKGTYYFVVIDDGTRIVGTGALIVEKKFIHDFGTIGHIEEISVLKDQQGKSLGKKVIETLNDVAVNVGCYKTILNCSEENEKFYAKCGYSRGSLEMTNYFEVEKSSYYRG
ncbi:Uncharacterized protein BP5553_03768 [Venustampulla echinocandica]|uniref:Glucosamine 6-phosphate N-acetyltransferase n=1 Tax=Venustampulla echinocandica TaxID=2656787 RepID=A0A370TVC8_9HELO|nr:Uncharacterized protein BP5553_03768 [Venustampulla echinocandica]RDL39428.1 Uncharacterized protein BP5553_03768 [Venustampulla echinocandica]